MNETFSKKIETFFQKLCHFSIISDIYKCRRNKMKKKKQIKREGNMKPIFYKKKTPVGAAYNWQQIIINVQECTIIIFKKE